jgi:hypothetical protein
MQVFSIQNEKQKIPHSSKIQLTNRRKRQRVQCHPLHIQGEQHVRGVIIVRFNTRIKYLKIEDEKKKIKIK